MAEFRLTILDPALAREFLVPVGITIIGRDPNTNLPLGNAQVSRRHAQILSDGQVCELMDLGSANGTFINEERLTPNVPTPLTDGMSLRFGPVALRFEILAQPAEAPDAVPADEPALPEDLPPRMDVEPEPVVDEADMVLDLGTPPEEPVEIEQPPAEVSLTPTGEPAPRDPDGAAPPDQPPESAPPVGLAEPAEPLIPPGLGIHSQRLINFLPGIYHTDFMARFLGIFESIQTPLEWMIDAFDLYLAPDTSPTEFLTWLAGWYGITFDASWGEDQRRMIMAEAHAIYARRGTHWALTRILEIYTGCTPEIDDTSESLEPFTFTVRIALPESQVNRTLITRLIDSHKPAHTAYRLELG